MYNDILTQLLSPEIEVETCNLSDYELSHFEADYVNETREIERTTAELAGMLGEY